MKVKKIVEYEISQVYKEFKVEMKINRKRTIFKVIQIGWNIDILKKVSRRDRTRRTNKYVKLDLNNDKDKETYKEVINVIPKDKHIIRCCEVFCSSVS